jgi:hypothetical protein
LYDQHAINQHAITCLTVCLLVYCLIQMVSRVSRLFVVVLVVALIVKLLFYVPIGRIEQQVVAVVRGGSCS